MNPQLLEYLRAAQNNQNPNTDFNNPSMVNMQDIQQLSMPMQPKENTYNPYRGADKAMEFARASLEMSEDQKYKAFNKALLAMGDHIAKVPVQRGFKNNLGTLFQAFGPALNAYHGQEEAQMQENMSLLDKIKAYQRQEAQDQRQAELDKLAKQEMLWKRGYLENQLEIEKQRQGVGNFNNILIPEEYRNSPNLDKNSILNYRKSKDALYDGIKQIDNIEKNIDKLGAISQNNWVSPIGGPISNQINPIKDFFAKFKDDSSLAKEVNLRKNIEANIGILTTELDRKLKGSGTLGQGMYDRLSKFFPNIKTDNLAYIKERLKNLKQDALEKKARLDESLKYNRYIDPESVIINNENDAMNYNNESTNKIAIPDYAEEEVGE